MLEKLYQCIIIDHDYRLVLLAAVICAFSCFTAINLQQHTAGSQKQYRNRWLILTGIAAGIGVWATHFVAMLAYDAGSPKSYDLLPTLASILIAIILMGAGFAIYTNRENKLSLHVAAWVLGLGIGAMHYTGMSGLHIWGTFSYDMTWAISALIIGIIGCTGTLLCLERPRGVKGQVWAAVCLTLAICGLHFTAMTALTVTPDPTVSQTEGMVSDGVLLVAVTLATFMVLASALATGIVDKHLADRRTVEARRLRNLANAAMEGIVLLDGKGAVVDANHSFLGLCGRHLEPLRGLPFTVCFQRLEFDPDRRSAWFVNDAILIGANEKEIPTEIFFRPVQDRIGAQMVAIVRDIRERRAAEQQINFLAHHDSITGVANRAVFQKQLEHAVSKGSSGRHAPKKHALYFVDIDDFKELNARLGHAAGDAALKEVAERLKKVVGDQGLVARLSADQFCILHDGVEHNDDADTFALALKTALVAPFPVADKPVSLTASIGIAMHPNDAQDPEVLLLRAEIAMKRAKLEGRGKYCFFEPVIDEKLEERRALKQDLLQALGRHELYLQYQPQYHAHSRKLSGFEVLLRWRHPEKGLISPGEFIPMAEETGVINEISIWMMNEACRAAKTWPASLGLAVNMSPIQFEQDGLVEIIGRIVRRHGLTPDRLELEITESILIADEHRALRILKKLKEAGMRLAMDDFGTGYSSLSYLQTFPFDKIKIDRSFVMQMDDDSHSVGIVRGVIGLAHGLGIPVLAEGVETEAQLALLQDMGCDEVQGFLLGRPERIEDYADQITALEQHAEQTA